MTLNQTKRLRVGDGFRRPSTNSHDTDGFRHYTVVDTGPLMMTVCDQHGNQARIAFLPYNAEWLKPATKEAENASV